MNDLKDMQDRLAKFKADEAARQAPKKDSEAKSINAGARAGTELVVSIVASAALGYGIDKWLGTKPWGLIIFLLLGMGAGFMAVYRITNNAGDAVGFTSLQNRGKTSTKRPENPDQKSDDDDSP